ncbi:MAG: endopeptidase La [Chloroflexi bacterium]|nr:endopeptidase La [Chloroflexota bacterium]
MISTSDRQEKQMDEPVVPEILPILPSGEVVVYPFMIFPVAVNDERRVKLLDEAAVGEKIIGLCAQRNQVENPAFEDCYSVGTAALIVRMLKMPEGGVQALLRGISRIRLVEPSESEPYLKAKVETLQEVEQDGVELQAILRSVSSLFEKMVSLIPGAAPELGATLASVNQPSKMADFVAANINLATAERQDLLETLDVADRMRKLMTFLNREIEILEIGSKIQSQVKSEIDKSQREYYLREQLKAIQKELGEKDDRSAEAEDYRRRIEAAQLPEEARKEAERELERMQAMNPASAEYSVIKTYLDWMINLPWNQGTLDTGDIDLAQRILDEDHYDLAKVKDRILDYLAVRQLRQNMKGPILCFVGPPGVGKTSLGQSIARALGRKFVRMSLGAVRDEAEIRGHRRTYVGALPGRIIQGIRRAESNNPVFMLDEVDKLGMDFRGDPSSALLEVLDPQQNFSLSDHYLDVPFDLSKVMFICTANLLDPIPPALMDRMEIIGLPGYTEFEKLQIAKTYLVKRQVAENGLDESQIEFWDEALTSLIRGYTREAGVRNLEREIGTVCRKVARRVAQGNKDKSLIDQNAVVENLGPIRFLSEVAGENDEVGIATGLAVTSVGGDVLFVEAVLVPGKGRLMLTGKLGDVMQESAQACLTLARSRAAALGVPEDFYENFDVHIHIPAGAIPKDGPSAGVTMATALVSALTRRPVSKDVAMTGEITLRGKVLPVGGIKEKVLAAHRIGITTLILPKENERDLAEIPPEVKEQIDFHLVGTIDEVLDLALKPKKSKEKEKVAAKTT